MMTERGSSALNKPDTSPEDKIAGKEPAAKADPVSAAKGTRTARKRVKKDYIVISFASYEDAMEMESFCHAGNIPGRLIPLPTQVSAGCGLCWRMEPQEWEEAEESIREKKLRFTGVHPVHLWGINH